MLFKLFLAFTLIPVAEIYVLIRVGEYIGALNTVAVVVITGVVGATLARIQGLHALYRIRASLLDRRIPSRELVDAVLILIAGILLLAPGFITDTAGVVLLLPQGRAVARKLLMNKIRGWVGRQRMHIDISSPGPG
ncbi:MAG TPA: FxsA family protein [Deltaproteobacteria bacterium]|jgi:UPF0716 protein FxsA|nr:FxsA family protein [Deltaproteobacteria bacterium]HON60760.1 FxsA family protein [Deltaproteobacteria bacterium]HOS26022.1 FxsA family protein [Deltaproteobacteria bacterium]HPL86870.1 FxsA family protein [Deltaproteobacteria bacterium]